MDWSRDNVLAIALENTVHLWQHVSGCHEVRVRLAPCAIHSLNVDT
jgi:hypothetical protein